MTNNEEEKSAVKRVACEVYSRIVGYLRPVQDWNKGKQQEFVERKTYAVPHSATEPGNPSESN
jgi:anaerobic ribonucleoside-triphosphate reductase